MYCSMKTTIDLPEDVLHRAKVAAAQRKTTLKELVLSGLQIVLSPGADQRQAGDLADALATGHNTKPVGRLGRQEIYERPALRRH
jgi:hypothetical protein